ncbi:hypothetical protein [Ralstonia pseudosolanacearum]|uniref:hypothetical protein n=1 Tax=Ralstonia pseudosolanacearum TaxID=1310165 RepID=UPI001FF870F6|nr:hypothetical protein [Ralstonia pseudosolanacearum]
MRRSIKESPGRRRYTGRGNAHVGRTIEQVKQAAALSLEEQAKLLRDAVASLRTT